MNELEDLRKEIDEVDAGIVNLYLRRMDTVRRIGQYKQAQNRPVYDPGRERALLNRVGEAAGPEHEYGVRALFQLLMAQSRAAQSAGGKHPRRAGAYPFPLSPEGRRRLPGGGRRLFPDRLRKGFLRAFHHVFPSV